MFLKWISTHFPLPRACLLWAELLATIDQSNLQKARYILISYSYCCYVKRFEMFFAPIIGEQADEELVVRLFLRRVFLDPLGLPIKSRPSWEEFGEQSPDLCSSSFSAPQPSSSFLTEGQLTRPFRRVSPVSQMNPACISNSLSYTIGANQEVWVVLPCFVLFCELVTWCFH